MSTIDNRNDLGLTDKNAGGGCCGGDSCSTSAAATDAPSTSSGTAVEEYLVQGMTCSHCVASVTEELSALDGVQSVNVQLDAAGASRVTVAADRPLDVDAVRAAIDEAGYSLVDSAR